MVNEDGLSHVLRQMDVTINQSDRGRIDEVEVARDQFAKRRLRAASGVFRKQLLAVHHLQSTTKDPLKGQTEQA